MCRDGTGVPPGINRTKRPFLSPRTGAGLVRRRVPFPPPKPRRLQHLLQPRREGGREGCDAAGTLAHAAAASRQAHSSLLLNKRLLRKKWKTLFYVFNYPIKFSTLNLIRTASWELHLKTEKTFASVLLIIVVAHFTLNINGLQLLFKWYGNCYLILKFPLSNKGRD